jgi:hypothetical protein
MPVRLQLSRRAGFNLQALSLATNGLPAIKVDRSTRYGNPFTAQAFWDAGYKGLIEVANANCVGAFKAWMIGERHWAHGGTLPDKPDLSPLRGKNMACWCAHGLPCHADVLLDLANRPACEEA